VRRAAEEVQAQRLERARLDLLPRNADERMEAMLARLEETHGPRAREAALRVGRAYTEFMVRALSHELVAAMTPIGTALELLTVCLEQPTWDRATTARVVGESKKSMHQMMSIIQSTRRYVTEAPGAFRSESLRALVDDAIATVSALPLARENGLEIALDVDPSLRFDAHRGPIVQVLTNVLKNAVEASSARRPIPIWIAAKRTKGVLEVSVTDKGVGMDEEGQKEAVRPFRSRKTGGTGLGLPLAKKLVEAEHRGAVQIASERGVGTTITLVLPVSQETCA
jgi:signal transduction histidine kinase